MNTPPTPQRAGECGPVSTPAPHREAGRVRCRDIPDLKSLDMIDARSAIWPLRTICRSEMAAMQEQLSKDARRGRRLYPPNHQRLVE